MKASYFRKLLRFLSVTCLIMLSLCGTVMAQDLSGTWTGTFWRDGGTTTYALSANITQPDQGISLLSGTVTVTNIPSGCRGTHTFQLQGAINGLSFGCQISGTACGGVVGGALTGNVASTDTVGGDANFQTVFVNGPMFDLGTFILNRDGNSCGYSLSPGAYAYNPFGGEGIVTVTTSSGSCDWTATSNDSWIHITSGSSGTVSGTVSYYVDANTTGNGRTGTITIGGQGFVIRQAKDIFIDDPQNALTPYIYAMSVAGITHGCGSSEYYCPSDPVTRSAMAVFIIRALYGDSFIHTQTPYFTDVPPTYGAFSYIQKFRDANITQVVGTYNVDGVVTRGQMAVFIVRALYGDNFDYTPTPYFTDVPPTYGAFSYIQKFRDVGITQVSGEYRVDEIVTRDQMAVFLARAFLGMP